jgi:hypothetical protein
VSNASMGRPRGIFLTDKLIISGFWKIRNNNVAIEIAQNLLRFDSLIA